MVDESLAPGFVGYTRWLAKRSQVSDTVGAPSAQLIKAARAARDALEESVEQSNTRERERTPNGIFESLTLLAAGSDDDVETPPELTTARGFQVTLAYDEGGKQRPSSIGVLVQCPADMIEQLQGKMAYLWNGTERFELGEFDLDGKTLGELPAGIQITVSDFASGKVQLETPSTDPE
jgi:hypothetical protein